MEAFKDIKLILNLAFALEMLSVGLIQYSFREALRSELVYTSLNALIGQVHGNCMGLLELVYYHLKMHDAKDTTADAIHTTLVSRKGSVSGKTLLAKNMQERNGNIMRMINKVMKFKTGSKLFGNSSAKEKHEKSIQGILSKVLKSVDAGFIELELVHESIRSVARQLPSTVVKQGPIVLPIVKSPFLPPLEKDAYTLVLDLDETLVHYCDVSAFIDCRDECRGGC